MKKLFAILLAVALMATISVPTFAAESQTSTITVVMKDSGGDGWAEGDFGFVSLSTDELVLGDNSGTLIEGITEFFILEDGTTDTITHTVAKDEVVYFRWIDPENASDEEASFNIYRDGILQYSCDDVTEFNGSSTVFELFFTSYPDQRGMNVTYTVDPTYTVTIPETVTIGAEGTEKTVSAEGVVVEKGQYVSVTLAENNNFTVKTTEGAELPYTVTANGEAVAAGGEILAVNPQDGKNGTATLTFDIDESAIKYAGTYTGSATFTIAVKDVPKAMINFTIDGTPYQAEEGMTWAEWIDSASNTIGLYLSDSADGVYWDWYCLIDATGAVRASDVIEAEAYNLILTES
jgi:hypothetical protein